MANVTSIQDDAIPGLFARGVNVIQKSYAITNGLANQGDTIALFKVPVGVRWFITGAKLSVSGTLGAGVTVQLRHNDGSTQTALTAATTAGGASTVNDGAQAGVPIEANGGDVIELVVGGGNIGAAATAKVTLFFNPR